MKELLLVLKASTKGDMSIFKIKRKKKNDIVLPIILVLIVMFSIYTYADQIGESLKAVGLSNILLTLFAFVVVMIVFIEGIYKASILFQARDNNLLFSLPIKKETILASRLIKLLIFEYLFELLFIIPAYIKYIMLVPTNLYFYLISILFLILLPLIPMVLACIIGYLMTFIASKTKLKNVTQMVLSFVMIILIFYASFNMQNFIANIATQAVSINDLISKIYLPIGLYVDLLSKFDLLKLLELILISILPVILFIYVFAHSYTGIINANKEVFQGKKKVKETVVTTYKPLKALRLKEIKNYFSSPVYVFNTAFGFLMLLVVTLIMCFNLNGVISSMFEGASDAPSMKMIMQLLPLLYMALILFSLSVSSITASSISLEGSKITLLKSLPISPKTIFRAKIEASNLITIPLVLLSVLIFIIHFKIDIVNSIYLIIIAFLIPTLIAVMGLIINMKYPKFKFNADVEVVKQSTSTLVAMLMGMVLSIAPIFLYSILSKYISNNLFVGLIILVYGILCIVLYKVLMNKEKEFYLLEE